MRTIPDRIEPRGTADYLAVMSRAIFQAGLSWKLIASKWDAYVRLFEGFDPTVVAAFGEGDVERLMADGGIVRTRAKIIGTIANAKAMLELVRRYGSMRGYLRSFETYAQLAADLKARFAFLGDLSVYYFVFRVGERVPHFEEWEQTIAGDHPRMREMIGQARAGGWEGEESGYKQAMAAAKKTSAKKSTAKKSIAKKATAKKSTASGSARKYSPATSAKVGEVMDEMKAGKLRSGGSGKKVTDRKQAIAIGLSEARAEGKKAPPTPKSRKKS